ncbi:MAG: nucleotidyltransferase domain-containing protein [Acidimicrobiales bacterium]|nr:nucleotidyltransferase domain-containing protein [Acidimicrobiales bacterium]
MDLTQPIRSVVPGVRGEVLAVLARTDRPLTGRGVAELTNGRASAKGVNLALRSLTDAGIVLVEDHPPAKLYRLNRDHLAAGAIGELASLRTRLIDLMREQLAGWDPSPAQAWLFGSAARGDGDEDSDIDVLVVARDAADLDDPAWIDQVEAFGAVVRASSGNACSVIEYTTSELDQLADDGGRLARDLRHEAIPLAGRSARRLEQP